MSHIKLKAKKAVNTAKVSSGEVAASRLEAIAAFAVLARGYCAWCEQQRKGRNPRIAAAQWLSRLNEGVMYLPRVSLRERLPTPPRSLSLQARQARKRTHLGMFTGYYRKVFDAAPDGTEEPILGSVFDDLTGVYDDLSDGLALYDNGYPLNAQHHWHVMYRLHWGLHATGALVAIYFQGPWAKR